MTDTPTVKFADLGLAENILKALTEAGYDIPTPIQAEAIPHIAMGGDVTGIAQTGTGKTAAFVLPMIQRLSTGRARARMPRCLILCPTRELAAQVAENFEKYGKYLKLTMALLIGGVSFKDQETLLQRGVDVLIATPGRLMDQFDRGKLLLMGVETLIIDEADRMLDMGFIPDIEKICTKLPANRQTLLFSATFPADIQRLAKNFQRDPKKIEVARPAQTAETITQHVVKLPGNDAKARRTALRRVIEACGEVKNGIVFCNRKVEVDIVAASLTKHGHDAAPIHGDLPQNVRMETLQRFRDGHLKLLVASDVAARGLDIPDVGHVFNFAPPPKDEDYVHRIGRTGRAGRKGESYTLVSPDDEKSWGFVLKMIKKDVPEFMPEGLLDELAALPPEEKRSRGRGDRERGRGGRGERDRDRGRSRGRREREEATAEIDAPETETVAVAAVAEPVEAVAVAVLEDRPKRERPARSERNEKRRERNDDQPRAERGDRSERSEKRERPQRDYKRKDDDLILEPAPDRVIGFGKDIPAFLKR
ncbi:DEAD/DEAH box helicase [Hyphomonas sp. WL0036]|uniref:DEAD/DEAH box helicase n=1 Tax=Hyphomonas sediminis TaxID=2866160 RepID=UPI001C813799|nr:DEAD/DEAH box helicase [Hyphomonas sediminis]MBY9065342.1 DEAD/DEAH box helicase [Hyphomonas sediminis]